jgi:hypothetical protein
MLTMAQLHQHAERLYKDLGRLADAGETELGEPLAAVYNTLLERAKTRFPKDQMVETLNPVTDSMHPLVVQALAGQLHLVLGNA